MTDFSPPPGYTTVRFDLRTSAVDARSAFERFAEEELKFRDVSMSHKPLGIDIEYHPIIPDVLLVAVKKMDNVHPRGKEIIVDQSCGVAVLRGAHVFSPGIIASPPGLKVGDWVSVYVDLKKKCLKGSLNFEGEKYFIGNGIAQVSRDDIFVSVKDTVSGVGVKMSEPIYLAPCLDLCNLPNLFFPQNLTSIVVGHILKPPPDTIVLDMCAAPGGKSTHLCSIMRAMGKVIALDRSNAKIQKILGNANRLGYSNIHAYSADSRKICSDTSLKLEDRKDDFSPPYRPYSFSHILLDAPCSALGQRPRFPCDIPKTQSEVASYPALQWQLFKTAIKLLSNGGTLVYSTCTTTFAENEQMVEKVLNEHPDISLMSQNPHIGNFGRKTACNLSEEQLKKLQFFDMLPIARETLHPADSDTIGFFIAKFRKSCEIKS